MLTENSLYWEKAVELFVKSLDEINYSKNYTEVYKAEKYAYEHLPPPMDKKTRPILNKLFSNYKLIVVKGVI